MGRGQATDREWETAGVFSSGEAYAPSSLSKSLLSCCAEGTVKGSRVGGGRRTKSLGCGDDKGLYQSRCWRWRKVGVAARPEIRARLGGGGRTGWPWWA